MVQELHKCGFEKLRIMPCLSPSGLHWRCIFISEKSGERYIASNWIAELESENVDEEIEQNTKELTTLFKDEHDNFLKQCKGRNK